uniref:Protein sel-1 homolog 1-like n=1 Tax=Hirondellea gigas TaxID=1518452 RepID=A0A2P2I8X2_9CRUS
MNRLIRIWLFYSMLLAAVCEEHLSMQQLSKGNPYIPNIWTKLYHPGRQSDQFLTQINKNADLGDLNSKAYLSFFKLLDRGGKSNVQDIGATAKKLSDDGSAVAHTLLGFLIKHNLTDGNLFSNELVDSSEGTSSITSGNEDVTKMTALGYFTLAAQKGDPLAQMVIGEYHANNGNCSQAVEMYRSAAVRALSTIKESMISTVRFGPFIDNNDGIQISWPSEEEIGFLEYQANNGDPEAALQAAAIFLSDVFGINYDPVKAVKYLKIAIDADISTAMVFMAHMHLDGAVENPDLKYARDLLERALDLEDHSAYGSYAKFYLEGLAGTPRNPDIARDHLKKGVEVGHVDAMFLLGQMLATSSSSAEDEMQAIQYWSGPAAHGHVHAAWYAAEFYSKLMAQGTVVISSSKKTISTILCESSLPLYQIVAQAGEWHNLRFAAFKDFKAERYDAAAMKYMLLSDLGYSFAHANLGRILQTDGLSIYNSTEVTRQQQLRAWELAANESIPSAFLELGHLHYYSSEPLSKSIAAQHYLRGKKFGCPESAFNVAYMYEWADGVEQNLTLASEYYSFSANVSEESWWPATLALRRLEFYDLVNSILSINLYSITSRTVDWHSIALNCYLVPELLVLCVLLGLILYRRE